MTINRTYIFITISSAALLVVLSIQVNWIVQTAKTKEALFNEKANIVLSKTAEALSRDKQTFKSVQVFVGRNEMHKIDSLFGHYMKAYNIHINYLFELRPLSTQQAAQPTIGYNINAYRQNSFSTCLEAGDETQDMELKLTFPDKRQFILAEMGGMFLTSVLLILVVLVLSWRTILSLMKEKKISEHTTDFLNNMTHEFKTPLTNISLAGKMMVKETNIGQEDKIKHYSSIILEENEKLRLQVEQVLSMTALERGEIPLQKTELDIHQLIRDALKHISIQIEHKQGSVTTDLVATAPVVTGDKAHLTNAIRNLIDNAIKYAKHKPELTIRTADAAGNVAIIIADKGIGIAKEYQKKVFDKFFRVPTGDVHDVKGFGLGLAYVKKIIELHGGTIALESDKGNGTVFTITLPHA